MCQPVQALFWRLWGRIHIQAYSGCWQVDCRIAVPVSSLAVSQGLLSAPRGHPHVALQSSISIFLSWWTAAILQTTLWEASPLNISGPSPFLLTSASSQTPVRIPFCPGSRLLFESFWSHTEEEAHHNGQSGSGTLQILPSDHQMNLQGCCF